MFELATVNENRFSNHWSFTVRLSLSWIIALRGLDSAIMSTICRVKGHKSFQIPENNSKLGQGRQNL